MTALPTQGLFTDGLEEERLDGFVRGAVPQGRPQIYLVIREEARP